MDTKYTENSVDSYIARADPKNKIVYVVAKLLFLLLN